MQFDTYGIRNASDHVQNAPLGTRLQTAMRRNNAALANARGSLFDAAAGFYALKAAIGGPVSAAMRFESAMADVRKVVDFPTPEAFMEFQNTLKKMSDEIPMTVNELAEMAAIGGSSGLSGEELVQFVEQAAKLGIAFDITAQEAGQFQNAMRNALKLDLTEVLSLGDAINHISNNMNATAPDLTNFMTRIAGDLEGFGFTAEQAAAFGATMIASGHAADVAATSFRNMGRYLTLGASNSKRTKDALRSIGLEATEVASKMQEDAVGTTLDVFERISQMPKEVQAALRSDIFGNEARALPGLISNLALVEEALGYVENEAEYAGSAFEEFEVRAKTFENAAQLFNNRLYKMKIVIGAALIPALNRLMEVLTPVIQQFTTFVEANPELVSGVMAAAASFIAFRTALAGLRFAGLLGRGGALSMLALGLNTIGRASIGATRAAQRMMLLNAALGRFQGGKHTRLQRLGIILQRMTRTIPGIGILAMGLKLLAGAAAAVGSALATITAPVWATIAAVILAVAAASFTLWRYWERLSLIAGGIRRRIAEELQPVFERIRPVIEAIAPATMRVVEAFGVLKNAAGAVISWFREQWQGFAGWLGGFFQREVLTDQQQADLEQRGYDMADRLIRAIRNGLSGLYQIGADAIGDLWEGMRDRFGEMLSWVSGIGNQIRERLGSFNLRGSGEAHGALSMRMRGYARGGNPQAGEIALVGEEGPELVEFGRAGRVYDAARTTRMLQNLQPATTAPPRAATSHSATDRSVHIGQIVIQGVQDIRGAAQEIKSMLEHELSSEMRGSYLDSTT